MYIQVHTYRRKRVQAEIAAADSRRLGPVWHV